MKFGSVSLVLPKPIPFWQAMRDSHAEVGAAGTESQNPSLQLAAQLVHFLPPLFSSQKKTYLTLQHLLEYFWKKHTHTHTHRCCIFFWAQEHLKLVNDKQLPSLSLISFPPSRQQVASPCRASWDRQNPERWRWWEGKGPSVTKRAPVGCLGRSFIGGLEEKETRFWW